MYKFSDTIKKDEKLDKEAKENLVGLFELLFKIDQRINPQNYPNTTLKNLRKSNK